MNTILQQCMVANEFITLQTDQSLKINLGIIVESLRQERSLSTDTLNNSPLSEIIKKRTGLKVIFDIDKVIIYNAALSFNPTGLNNVLMEDSIKFSDKDVKSFNREVYGDLVKTGVKLDSIVNIKESRVSGIFSETELYLTIGSEFFKKRSEFTTEEVAAIILHELGHAFCNFMYVTEMARTNMVLSSLNRMDYFNSDKNKKIEILTNIEKSAKVVIDEKETIAVSNDDICYSVLIKDILERPRSELKSDMFDARTFEFISDQFATMHGAGSDLATGLFKFSKRSKQTTTSVSMLYIFSVLKALYLVFGTYIKISKGGIPGRIILLVSIVLNMTVLKADLPLYDNPLLRITKIKEQHTAMLRDRSLSDDRKKNILAEINKIEKLLEITKEYPNIKEFVSKIFLPWIKKKHKVVKLQHDYEAIVNNPFFEHSARMELN